MFGWFKRKDAFGYTQDEREIFSYWDGKRRRKGDPLAIQRALFTDPKWDYKYDPDVAKHESIEGLKAAGRIIDAIRRAFKLTDMDHGGLTDGECLNLFFVFAHYIGQLQEESRPLVSSPGPTASAAESTPTAPSADSGSIESAPAEVSGA